jgi:hypothetical protein
MKAVMRNLSYHKNHYSVLHIAAAYYSDDPTYSELLEIVLDHYDKPEYLDAKASNNAKSTPSRPLSLCITKLLSEVSSKQARPSKRRIHTAGQPLIWPSDYLRGSPTRDLTPITAKIH